MFFFVSVVKTSRNGSVLFSSISLFNFMPGCLILWCKSSNYYLAVWPDDEDVIYVTDPVVWFSFQSCSSRCWIWLVKTVSQLVLLALCAVAIVLNEICCSYIMFSGVNLTVAAGILCTIENFCCIGNWDSNEE